MLTYFYVRSALGQDIQSYFAKFPSFKCLARLCANSQMEATLRRVVYVYVHSCSSVDICYSLLKFYRSYKTGLRLRFFMGDKECWRTGLWIPGML